MDAAEDIAADDDKLARFAHRDGGIAGTGGGHGSGVVPSRAARVSAARCVLPCRQRANDGRYRGLLPRMAASPKA